MSFIYDIFFNIFRFSKNIQISHFKNPSLYEPRDIFHNFGNALIKKWRLPVKQNSFQSEVRRELNSKQPKFSGSWGGDFWNSQTNNILGIFKRVTS